MNKLIIALLACAFSLPAQTLKSVTVCWQADGGQQNCQTFQPGTTALITVDLRGNPVQAVVVQPLPAYQVNAMQQLVDGQTYHLQQADGSVVTKHRYTSVQDLIIQNAIRNILIPSLKLYPAPAPDAGKTNYDAIRADLDAASATTVIE